MPTPSLNLHRTNTTRAKGLFCLWTHFGRFKAFKGQPHHSARSTARVTQNRPLHSLPPSFHCRSPRRLTSCHPIKVNSCHVRWRRRRLVVPLVAGVAPTPSSLLLSRASRVSSPNSLLVQIIVAAGLPSCIAPAAMEVARRVPTASSHFIYQVLSEGRRPLLFCRKGE